jgi:hypothetical protein
MTIQTTTDETFEAQLRADDQNVLWLIDATDGRYQLAVSLRGGWRILDATPSERVVLESTGSVAGAAVNDAAWWARVVQARTERDDLRPQRVWTLHKGERSAAIDVKGVPGIGAEIVLTVDGEMRKTRLFRSHEQAELSGAIADTRATFEAKGWA